MPSCHCWAQLSVALDKLSKSPCPSNEFKCPYERNQGLKTASMRTCRQCYWHSLRCGWFFSGKEKQVRAFLAKSNLWDVSNKSWWLHDLVYFLKTVQCVYIYSVYIFLWLLYLNFSSTCIFVPLLCSQCSLMTFCVLCLGCVGVVEQSVLRITTGSELINDVQTGALLPVTSPLHSN